MKFFSENVKDLLIFQPMSWKGRTKMFKSYLGTYKKILKLFRKIFGILKEILNNYAIEFITDVLQMKE